jgi:hypothetical protein
MGSEKWPGHDTELRCGPITLADVAGVAVLWKQGEVDLATLLVVRTAFGHGQRNRVCDLSGMAF